MTKSYLRVTLKKPSHLSTNTNLLIPTKFCLTTTWPYFLEFLTILAKIKKMKRILTLGSLALGEHVDGMAGIISEHQARLSAIKTSFLLLTNQLSLFDSAKNGFGNLSRNMASLTKF